MCSVRRIFAIHMRIPQLHRVRLHEVALRLYALWLATAAAMCHRTARPSPCVNISVSCCAVERAVGGIGYEVTAAEQAAAGLRNSLTAGLQSEEAVSLNNTHIYPTLSKNCP